MQSQKKGRNNITLRLDESNERFLRIKAVEDRTTMSNVINEILDKHREEAK